MAVLNIKVDEDPTPELQIISDEFLIKAVSFLDIIAEIMKEITLSITPIGETKELYDMTDIIDISDLERYIGSESEHFAPLVEGHEIMGVFNSEKQTRWWFWYLNAVLGGSYDPKYGTGSKTPEFDYPSLALDMSEYAIDASLEEFGDWIVGG